MPRAALSSLLIALLLVIAAFGCRRITHCGACDECSCTDPSTDVPTDLPAEMPTDAVLEMHFEESAGAVFFEDSSGYENHGECAGFWCPTAGVEGYYGSALEYDGDTQYVRVPHSASISPQAELSISAWFFADVWDGNNRIVQKGDDDSSYRFLAENGALLFHIKYVDHLTINLPSPEEWHHGAAVYDGNSMQIWVDGLKVAEAFVSGPIQQSPDPLRIGTKKPEGAEYNFFNGRIDELYIFDRALTAGEIAKLAGE